MPQSFYISLLVSELNIVLSLVQKIISLDFWLQKLFQIIMWYLQVTIILIISGSSAAEWDKQHPDWVPTIFHHKCDERKSQKAVDRYNRCQSASRKRTRESQEHDECPHEINGNGMLPYLIINKNWTCKINNPYWYLFIITDVLVLIPLFLQHVH